MNILDPIFYRTLFYDFRQWTPRAEKKRIWFNTICLKLYQFERITWWCMYVLEFVMDFTLQFVMKYVVLE
jgi:hypothetical protein